MQPPLPGEVAWYVTGRFYATPEGTAFDAGYFLHLQGIGAPIFRGGGERGEGTALLTFLADPFTASPVAPNGDLALSLDPVGDFAVYLRREGGARFDDPASFGAGEEVARFRRASVVMGTTLGGAASPPAPRFGFNVFSARLVASRPFELGGRVYDLGQVLPHGVTQWGTSSPTPVGGVPGFTSVVPFVGSAVAIGAPGPGRAPLG